VLFINNERQRDLLNGPCNYFLTTRKAACYVISIVSLCQKITFESSDVGSLCFTQLVYIQGLWVKFVYEGYLVKVMVTGSKQIENPYSHNVKLRSAITPVL